MPAGVSETKAPTHGAFFAFACAKLIGAAFGVLLTINSSFAAATPCAADAIDSVTKVAYVYDGDTVKLDDGRHVRFIGINAPEIAHNGKPAQAFGDRARRQLRALLARHHYRIALRYDVERTDHYGRTLAHLYLRDGTSIEAWLLQRGLATTLVVPPNAGNVECYADVEQAARRARTGLWSLPSYQVIAADRLSSRTRGYRLVQGTVRHVGRSTHALWLDFAGGFAVRIDRTDLKYFPALAPTALRGKTVLVRGWIHSRRGKPQMRVRHPAALKIVR